MKQSQNKAKPKMFDFLTDMLLSSALTGTLCSLLLCSALMECTGESEAGQVFRCNDLPADV